MKLTVTIILIAVVAFALGLYLPWWSVAIAAFIVSAMIQHRPLVSFLAGFIGIFLLWFVLAMVIDVRNQHILSKKLALLLPLSGNSFLLILITALIGALVGANAALTASFIRKGMPRAPNS
jgi:hypothetical protein